MDRGSAFYASIVNYPACVCLNVTHSHEVYVSQASCVMLFEVYVSQASLTVV